MIYVIVEAGGNLLSAYSSKADAEEALFEICASLVYEIFMIGDPAETMGKPQWNYSEDYWYLMNNCAQSFKIVEIPIFN